MGKTDELKLYFIVNGQPIQCLTQGRDIRVAIGQMNLLLHSPYTRVLSVWRGVID